ncbi:MAG: hypothetical protein AAGJ18_03665, partial [Bacteroidota bacterium]
MTQLHYRFLHLSLLLLFVTTTLSAQSVNFEETWKEFLENNKISNMSALNKPSKQGDPLNYIKYLLMNTNNNFCQSDVEKAERYMTEINEFSDKAYARIPQFTEKKTDLEAKIKAYYQIDALWQNFVDTKEVNIDELEGIKAAKTLCEKETLAKYSYMQAYHNYCQGNVSRAKAIIENRTLKLAEKTTMRVEDIPGLKPELAKMKKLFQNINELENQWDKYTSTGVSPGYDTELPLFPCNPIPNIKAWTLKGAFDVCGSGQIMLEKIKQAQKESGVQLDAATKKNIKKFEKAVKEEAERLAALNTAWKKFIPNNEIKKEDRTYGYEYCTVEPLIKAHIMDGFANICGNAEDRLEQITELKEKNDLDLPKTVENKIMELEATHMQFQTNELDINDLWQLFLVRGDAPFTDYYVADYYCDHVYDVKSWVIQGASTDDCKTARAFLEQVDEVKKNLEFEFAKDIRCEVEKLRLKVWTCQYEVLSNLAKVEDTEAAQQT